MGTLILSNFSPLSQYMNITLAEAEDCQSGDLVYRVGKIYGKEVTLIDVQQSEQQLAEMIRQLAEQSELVIDIGLGESCYEHLRPGDIIVQGNDEGCNKLIDSFLQKYDGLVDETKSRAFKGKIKLSDDCQEEHQVACSEIRTKKVQIDGQLPRLDFRIIHAQQVTDYSMYSPVLHKLISVLKQVIGGI